MNMKVLLLATAIASTGLFATSANAANGTITFNGNIQASTCQINNGSPSFTVTLPSVGTTAFAAAGDWAGRTPFSISLTGCGSLTNTVSAYFEPGPTINAAGRLHNSGTAAGVDVALLNASQGMINLNTQAGTSTAAISGGSATLNYYAEYYANAASVGAGTVNSTVTYTIKYQ